MKDFLLEKFFKVFNYKPKDFRIFFAPGRVNLIGEHTDYTGGLVFPASINCGTYILAVKNNTKIIKISSLNFDKEIINIDIEKVQTKDGNWADYFKGCFKELKIDHEIDIGFDALVYGNIPNGSGLSSSASFEMVSLITIMGINNIKIPENGSKEMVELTIKAKNCENNFVGVNCGIMDQFAIGNGKKNCAIMLDCFDLSFSYASLDLGEYSILVSNTNKKRRLEESKYNERRKECEDGFEMLKRFGVSKQSLGRVTIEEWDNLKDKFNDNPIIKKRLNHVITENTRVKRAYNLLKSNNILAFSNLLNFSGDSLRDDFEVTGFHLDAMVESSRTTPGVVASRMTGAGFGGCAVSIVEKNKLDKIIKEITKKYFEKTNIPPEFYSFEIDDGAREIF
ncbi:MAG TPA: galactokinase [Spirochaetota bacterium]|nr:galactokinase [Spirochaetota bacterium]